MVKNQSLEKTKFFNSYNQNKINMKTILTLLIIALVILLGCDIEANSKLKTPDYSNSIMYVFFLLIVGFVRFFYNEFKDYYNGYQ